MKQRMHSPVWTFRIFVAVALSSTACAGNPSAPDSVARAVQISMDKTNYQSGDTVVTLVKNASDVQLTYPYGFCKTVLQQLNGTDWTTVATPSDGCPLALGLLDRSAVVPNRYVLPAGLPPGRYRLLMPAPEPKNAQKQDTLVSPTFLVNSVTL